MAEPTHDPQSAHDDEAIEIDTEDARAGTAPGMMRYVLIISMILVIAVFAILVLARR